MTNGASKDNGKEPSSLKEEKSLSREEELRHLAFIRWLFANKLGEIDKPISQKDLTANAETDTLRQLSKVGEEVKQSTIEQYEREYEEYGLAGLAYTPNDIDERTGAHKRTATYASTLDFAQDTVRTGVFFIVLYPYEKRVFVKYLIDDVRYADLCRLAGVTTAERVRQIINEAAQKMYAALPSEVRAKYDPDKITKFKSRSLLASIHDRQANLGQDLSQITRQRWQEVNADREKRAAIGEAIRRGRNEGRRRREGRR